LAPNRERLDSLEERVRKIEDALIHSGTQPKIYVPRSQIVGILAIVCTIILSAMTAVHSVDKDIAGESQKLDSRLEKDESAIKVLGSQQSDQVQKLIHDLLAIAKTSDSSETAARAAEVAASLTVTLQKGKHPSPPEFFHETTQDLDALHQQEGPIRQIAFKTQTQLAEYRSALELVNEGGGTVVNCTGASKHGTLFGAGHGPEAKTDRTVSNMAIKDCSQILDGIAWQDVTFIDSNITYHGGPVVLRNVTFVNCKFNVDSDDYGFKLLEYAALDQKELKIKPEFFG
jgi:hypothetical protein